ncbi:MAG TPA: 6-carboxytetrahydropterin synthase [Candidatus Dormibacteraeota bacterium]|nr:6-carboxytetrahydropterin synthase [Candidatus Dormibacteraeota bacterium]
MVDAFEAAHRLKGDFGPATRQHGHTYRVELTVRGPSLHADGTLYDAGRLRAALRAEMETLHYQDLTEMQAFAGKNSTAEEVASHLLERLRQPLADPRIVTISVRVWESPEVFAGVEARIG